MNRAAPRRLMAVHAHPDDESSKGAGTAARYVAQGDEVLIAYDEDGGYPHPDHIQAHRVAVAAYAAAADPRRFPDAGEPWQVAKLYYDRMFSGADHNPFFFWPNDVLRTAWPTEEFQLIDSKVETQMPETDLFAGIEGRD